MIEIGKKIEKILFKKSKITYPMPINPKVFFLNPVFNLMKFKLSNTKSYNKKFKIRKISVQRVLQVQTLVEKILKNKTMIYLMKF